MKFIEVPDFHFDVSWAEVSEKCADSVNRAAEENKADFIAMPGDITNKALQTSEKGGINKLRGITSKLAKDRPVVVVYGTPSHEPPGSLEHLVDCGLTILRPGIMYGLVDGKIYPAEICDLKLLNPDCLLFGIPELSKKNIQAQLNISASEANAEAVTQFNNYVKGTIAPLRSMHPDIPAVCLFHGNVSDSRKEFSTDIILKASDIVIHSEDLEEANIDRWALAHIHIPWESSVVSAGYAGFTGMDGNPYGKLGFKPAMNLVEISSSLDVDISRIPYGTPERRKITDPIQAVEKDIAYWLDSKDKDAKLPEWVHPWSKVTFNPERKKSNRVTKEEAANISSLRDLFRLIDPTVQEDVLKLVDGIESHIGVKQKEPINVKMLDVEAHGMKLFKGKDFKWTADQMNPGLNRIGGGNGQGKSSGLSLISMYPQVIGKDYRSLKTFFNMKDSYIIKHAEVDGKIHELKIQIAEAHTKSAKIECYYNVDGEPKLDCGSYDEAVVYAEKTYGSFNDYLLTSFYVQPLQGKTSSSLMSATMTDIRDLVQNIADIGRDSEKEFSLAEVRALKDKIKEISAKLSGAKEFQVDIEALKDELNINQNNLVKAQELVTSLLTSGKQKRIVYTEAQAEEKRSAAEEERSNRDSDRLFTIENSVTDKRRNMEELEVKRAGLAVNLDKLKADTEARGANANTRMIIEENCRKKREFDQAVEDELREIKIVNADLKREYDQFVREAEIDLRLSKEKYLTLKKRLEFSISQTKSQIEYNLNMAESSLIKCSKCGHVEDEAKKNSEKAATLAERFKSDLKAQEAKFLELIEPKGEAVTVPEPIYEPERSVAIEPTYTTEPDILPELPNSELPALQHTIDEGRKAEALISAELNNINTLLSEKKDLLAKTYNINKMISVEVERLSRELESLTLQYQNASNDKVRLESLIGSLTDKISAADKTNDKIKNLETELIYNEDLLTKWTYIAGQLQSSKIPAMELDLVLEEIDETANSIIAPYQSARFSYETRTQEQVGKNLVDRFDIRIYDSSTGEDKSFLEHSPGEKAFFADAYVKSLVAQRNRRAKRSYSPVIMDEADGPIDPNLIADYYNIQSSYWKELPVLIVSHSPTSHEYVENNIDIKELLS